jgi:hypothetical protein
MLTLFSKIFFHGMGLVPNLAKHFLHRLTGSCAGFKQNDVNSSLGHKNLTLNPRLLTFQPDTRPTLVLTTYISTIFKRTNSQFDT